MVNGVLGLHGDTAVKRVAMGQKREHEVADVHPRKELDHLALALLFKILLVWNSSSLVLSRVMMQTMTESIII